MREQADKLLRAASAHGRFPTPIDDIIAAARLSVEREASLDQGFLKRLYGGVTGAIKHAIDKVTGLFHSGDKMIYLDLSVGKERQRFVSLHETGHGYLPWQRDLYALLEDGEMNLDPDVEQDFERQAGIFASEVLFQLDSFRDEARSLPFEIKSAMKLAKRYGASNYAAFRRFVTSSHRACALLVFEQPIYLAGRGHEFRYRRAVPSPSFTARYGKVAWPPAVYEKEDQLAARLPLARFRRRFTKRCRINSPVRGESERFYIEAFDSTHQVLALIFPESELKAMKTVV